MAYTTIDNPGLFFNTVLFTGSGSTQSITGVGFKPDWIWFKNRTDARAHALVDSVRGTNKVIVSDSANAEATTSSGRDFESFDTDGFTVNNPLAYNSFNESGDSIVAWNWLGANGTVSNGDGDITSTVSANTTSGFSIVAYTGTGSNATIGHGLGAVPKMIILKELNPSTTRSFRVYYESVGNNKVMYLDVNNTSTSDTTAFNSTTPTSSLFTVGTSVGTNESGKNYIAYCFAEIKGYSKFHSYTGNGSSSDGTFVHTGFLPAFVMIKKSSGTSNWTMWDTARLFNEINKPLYADTTAAESAQSTVKLDLLSNGFKLRGNGSNINSSGGTYTYMAFAENPFVTEGTKAAGTAR